MATMLRLSRNGDPCGAIQGVLPDKDMRLDPGYSISWRDFFSAGTYRAGRVPLSIVYIDDAVVKFQIGFFNGRQNELCVEIQGQTAIATRNAIEFVMATIGEVVHADLDPKGDSFVRGVRNDLRRLWQWWRMTSRTMRTEGLVNMIFRRV